MSIQSMVWALEQRVVEDAPARHVLLCLANYADKAGRGAFPSTNSLSDDTGLSVRTVKYKLDDLEKLGVIRRGNQALAAVYIDRHDRRPIVYDMVQERGAGDAPRFERGAAEDVAGCSSEQNGVQLKTERGAGAAPNPSSTRQLSVNNPLGDKSLDSKVSKAKFDPCSARPGNVSPDAWEGFCEMRISKKKPLTERACKLIAKALINHPAPDAVIDKSTTNSWTDIYPDSVMLGAGAKNSAQSAVLSVPTHTPEMYPNDRF